MTPHPPVRRSRPPPVPCAVGQTHPLLTEVARHSCRAADARAAAITRAYDPSGDGHEVVAFAGEQALADELALPARRAFAGGAQVVTATAVSGLLTLDDGVWGALTLLRPAGSALAAAAHLADLAPMATEALRAAETERHAVLTLDASVGSLASLLDLRDGYTGQHSTTVVALCEEVARRLGMTGDDLDHLRIAAHLHDLGKIGVPDAILHKSSPLDEAEWSIMREHPVWGARALEAVPGFRQAAAAVRSHHERWDGSGYPDGLVGQAIPLPARIIAVCDAFDAMTSTRPYRGALPVAEACAQLVAGNGTQFDPAAVWALLDTLPG
jgi:HD-GYP domain-containing protein (c-di-GMP phosphodiesterase class II)